MTIYAVIMSASLIITSIMLFIIARQKPKNQMQQIFLINIILLFIYASLYLCKFY